LVLVLLGAYFTTRFIGRHAQPVTKGRYIKIIDSVYFARDKSFMLVEVGGVYYLVGVTNQSMQLLGTMEDGEPRLLAQEGTNGLAGFNGAMARIMESFKKARNAPRVLAKERERQKLSRKETAQTPAHSEKNALRLVKKTKEETDAKGEFGPAQEGMAQQEPGGAFVISANDEGNDFKQYLRDAGVPESDCGDVIVTLTSDGSKKLGALFKGKPARQSAPAKGGETDEIDKMMRSIEERTAQAKKKKAEDTHEDE
jgi:flagellar biogenesis protein FliO